MTIQQKTMARCDKCREEQVNIQEQNYKEINQKKSLFFKL